MVKTVELPAECALLLEDSTKTKWIPGQATRIGLRDNPHCQPIVGPPGGCGVAGPSRIRGGDSWWGRKSEQRVSSRMEDS